MKNESLDWRWLGWVHPVTPLLVWLPVSIGAIMWGATAWQLTNSELALFATAALVSWSLLEYTLHRFLFHPPCKSKKLCRWAQAIHGKHHGDPNHLTFALVSPVNAAVILLSLAGIFFFLVPSRGLTVFIGFFLLGYLSYEYLHLAIHHQKPRTRLGKFLARHHLSHHAQNDEGNFGVTSHLWDWLLGTWRRGS